MIVTNNQCGFYVWAPIGPHDDPNEMTVAFLIPFCKHLVFDGDAVFCLMGIEPEKKKRCNSKMPVSVSPFEKNYIITILKRSRPGPRLEARKEGQ